MKNYSPDTPLSKDGIIKEGYVPAKLALASVNKENTSTSSVMLFTHDTTEIEVAPVTVGVAIRWATNSATSVVTAAGTANWDSVVPAGESRRYVVPIQTFVTDSSSIQGVNRANGLYPGVAFKTIAGAGSVLLAEY